MRSSRPALWKLYEALSEISTLRAEVDDFPAETAHEASDLSCRLAILEVRVVSLLTRIETAHTSPSH